VKYKAVTMGLKRTVRHERYILSSVEAKLEVEITTEDDEVAVVEELHEDLVYLVEKMVAREVADYNKNKEDKND